MKPFASNTLHVGSYSRPIFEEVVQYVYVTELKFIPGYPTHNKKGACMDIAVPDAEGVLQDTVN